MNGFEDHRGRIEDILEHPIDAITRITTVEGAVRGNHVHHQTTQWTYLLTGQLRMVTGDREFVANPGDLVIHEPGEPHAWKALEDTDCLVFTRGPRSGRNYEWDTQRLEEPLIA